MSGFDLPPDFLDTFNQRLDQVGMNRAARVAAAMADKRSADALGEARELSERLGDTDPMAVVDDLESARRRVMERELRDPSFEARFPVLSQRIGEDFKFLSMARDDLGNLKSTEGTFDWVGRSFDNSFANMERSLGATWGRLTGRMPIESPAQRQVRLERAQVAYERDQDNWGADAINVLTSLGATVTGGAVGFAAGGPVGAAAGAASVSFALSSGEVYNELIDLGYTPAQADGIADTWGGVMAALDLVGAGRVSSAFSKTFGKSLLPKLLQKGLPLDTKKQLLRSAVAEYAKDIGIESGTEVLQQAAVIMARFEAHKRFGEGEFEAGDIPAELWDTLVHTARGMTLVGLPGLGARALDSRKQAANAQQAIKSHTRIESLEAESKLRQRSPEARASFNQDAAPDDIKTVYIRPDKLIETVEQIARDPNNSIEVEQFERSMPGLLQQARDAMEAGNDVEVDFGDWTAKLANSVVGRALMPHAVFHQDADTAAERGDIEALEGEFGALADEAKARAEEDDAYRETLDGLYDKFYTQARAAGRPAAEARAFATLTRNTVASLARAEGLGLAEFVEKNQVVSVRTEGEATFAQDSDAFRAWFGDSKVVDENGQPLVVYHGTVSELEAFRPGSHFGTAAAAADRVEIVQSRRRGPPRTVPVYLSVRNPLRIRDNGLTSPGDLKAAAIEALPPEAAGRIRAVDVVLGDGENFGDQAPGFAAIIEALGREGFDGLIYRNSVEDKGSDSYIAFRPEQIKSVNNRGTFDSSDPNILRQDGDEEARGGFDASLNAILLNKDADSSTLFHELAHYYLAEIARMAKDAPAQKYSAARETIKTLLEWHDTETGKETATSIDEWLALDPDGQRAVHEAFALNFERYLYEGVAPSAELKSLFQRLRAFMVSVYTDVIQRLNRAYRSRFDEDLPGLTDEVRQVFGRMVVTEAEVKAAFDAQQFEVLFESEAEATANGMTPQEYKRLMALHREAEDEAIDQLTRDRLRSMELASGATQGMLKTLQQKHDRRRREIRKEVEAAVKLSLPERVRSWLRNGEHLDEAGEIDSTFGANTSHKINREAAAAMVDARTLKRLEAANALTNTGVDPEIVAASFDVETGDQLLEMLATAPEFGDAVKQQIDERMRREHPELTDPKLIREQVAAAVHNKVRKNVVAQELKHLLRTGESARSLRRAAQNVAQRRILAMDVKDVAPSRFTIAARRARRAATKAIKDGDLPAAQAAKRQELMAETMAAEATAFRKEKAKAETQWRKAFRSDTKLGKTREMNVVHILRSLLAMVDAGRAQTNPESHLEQVKLYAPEAVEQWERELSRVAGLLTEKGLQIPQNDRPRYDLLTVDEFREVAALAERLWTQSSRIRTVTLGGKRQLREDAVDRALDQIDDLVEKRRGETGDVTVAEDVGGGILSYFAEFTRVEHLFRRLGGIYNELFQRVKDGALAKRDALRKVAEEIRDDIKALDLGKRGQIRSPELNYVFGNRKVAKAEILGMLLHYYSHSSNDPKGVTNRAKLLGWGEELGWTEAKVEAFVERMVNEGVLTEADFQWMQRVYDRNASYLEAVQKTHYEAYGRYMPVVDTESFETPFGTFKGGYVPAVMDRKTEDRVADFDQDKLAQMHGTWPVYERGFTEQRVGGTTHKLDFDIGNQVDHVDGVLNFIHVHPAVRDVSMIFNDARVQAKMNRTIGGKVMNKVVKPWLKRSAEQSLGPPAETATAKTLTWLARGAQMTTMFFNVVNALQNWTGFGPILRETKLSYVSSAAMRYASGPVKMGQAASAKSKEMAERLEQQMFETRKESNEILLGNGMVKKAGRWINRNTYILQTVTQHQVDVIGWWAKFDQTFAEAVANGMTEAEADAAAIREADGVIRRTQMAGNPEDISTFEGQGGVWKAIAPFKSWFINWFNYTGERFRLELNKEGVDRVSGLLATWAATFLVPGVIATVMADAIREGGDDDDEDRSWLVDSGDLMLRGHVDLITGPFALYGDLARTTAAAFDDKSWNNRMPAAPYARLLERLAQAPKRLAEGDEVGDFTDIIGAIGAVLHIPIDAFGKRIKVLADGESADGFDLARRLMAGR